VQQCKKALNDRRPLDERLAGITAAITRAEARVTKARAALAEAQKEDAAASAHLAELQRSQAEVQALFWDGTAVTVPLPMDTLPPEWRTYMHQLIIKSGMTQAQLNSAHEATRLILTAPTPPAQVAAAVRPMMLQTTLATPAMAAAQASLEAAAPISLTQQSGVVPQTPVRVPLDEDDSDDGMGNGGNVEVEVEAESNWSDHDWHHQAKWARTCDEDAGWNEHWSAVVTPTMAAAGA